MLGYKKLKQQIVYLKGIKQVQLRALVMQTCSKVFILILFIAQLRFMYLGEVEISYEDVAAFLQVEKHTQNKNHFNCFTYFCPRLEWTLE